MFALFTLIPLITLAKAVPQATPSNDCVGSISSLSDVKAAVQCKTVNINSFIVPGGETFHLDLLQGTTVNVLGDIQFEHENWSGPLFELTGQDIKLYGNDHKWDGNGPLYWDGLGGNRDGTIKPSPMMSIFATGVFSGVRILNSPANAIGICNDYDEGSITIEYVVVDNRKGNHPNSNSGGKPAGCNTDGFDVTGRNVAIRKSTVINQDDCLAINRGSNILFEDNQCYDGHGISIGSVSSNTVVEDVLIRGNTVVNSVQAFRIKTDRDATNSKVNNITYTGNTAANCTSYGVIITQSYPEILGQPGDGVVISNVSFITEDTQVGVVGDAETVVLDCGKGSCQGKWDWSKLETSGGKFGQITNSPSIEGYTI